MDNVPKFLLELLATSVIGAIILSIVNYIIGVITPHAGVFESFLMAVIAVVFFVSAIRINPGKEEFITTLPQVVLAIAVVDLLRNLIPQIPSLIIPFDWTGLAFGLGSIFFANALTKKFLLVD